MEQRERLIELLDQNCGYVEEQLAENLADYLLVNGVVVLPCKAGDMVYDIYEAFHNGGNDIRALKVTDIHIYLDKRNKAWIIIGGYYFALDDFGKTVFLTREEAERVLEKRKGG